MRILIVDDSQDSGEITEAALLSAGYTDVKMTDSASGAFKLLDIGKPTGEPSRVDVVLLDIVMPGIDGIEACARIRGDPRYGDLPIIMVTSLQDMDSLGNAFVAGATDYVSKPINRIEIVARVRAAIKLKSELDRRQSRERDLLTFLSTSGEHRAGLWIDPVTGLFVGEVAEAYLMAATELESDTASSVLALAVDRLEAYRSTQGEDSVRNILMRVAHAVKGLAGKIGIIPAVYRSGMIVLVAPELAAAAARDLGETLRTTVCGLDIDEPDAVAPDRVTASVAVVTGCVGAALDRIHLLTNAIATVRGAEAAGGNRVVAVSV
jgi:PleD family two-component response regulator